MIPIKIQCACGQRYAFDIEPVDGQMPSPVACPSCGADGTPAANEIISQQLASPAPAATATPPPPPPPPSGLRTTRPPASPPTPPPPAPAPATALKPVGSSITPVTKLVWYEQVWAGLPLALVFVGGAIGGGIGGAAWALNRQVFQKTKNRVLRYVWTGLISMTAVAAYVGIVIVFLGLKGKR